MLNARMDTAQVIEGGADVFADSATTTGIVLGGATAVTGAAPAGVDEVSALASANTAASAADLLTTQARAQGEQILFGAALLGSAGVYQVTDISGGLRFL